MMDTENIIGRKYGLQGTRNTTARRASCVVISLASLSKRSIISFEQIVKFISLITSDVWFMQAEVTSPWRGSGAARRCLFCLLHDVPGNSGNVFVIVDICCGYVVEIAEVTMGEPAKQG
jgi:hypothetical protein